jgi:hypothetical protein
MINFSDALDAPKATRGWGELFFAESGPGFQLANLAYHEDRPATVVWLFHGKCFRTPSLASSNTIPTREPTYVVPSWLYSHTVACLVSTSFHK